MSSEIVKLFSLFGLGAVLVLIIGLYSILTTRNLFRVFVALEILTKSVTLLLIAAGYAVGRTALAQALAITLIIIEVAVVVVAVGIILCFHRHHQSVDATLLREIKG